MKLFYGIVGEATIQAEALVTQMQSVKAIIDLINTRIRTVQRHPADLPSGALLTLASDVSRLVAIAADANRTAIAFIGATRSAIEPAIELLARNHGDEPWARTISATLKSTLQVFDVAEQVLHRYETQASRDIDVLHELAVRCDVPPDVIATVNELLLSLRRSPRAS